MPARLVGDLEALSWNLKVKIEIPHRTNQKLERVNRQGPSTHFGAETMAGPPPVLRFHEIFVSRAVKSLGPKETYSYVTFIGSRIDVRRRVAERIRTLASTSFSRHRLLRLRLSKT